MDDEKPRVIVASSVKNNPPSGEAGTTGEAEAQPINPWIRFFARYMDYAVYLLIISFIALRVSHKPELTLLILSLTKQQLVMLMLVTYIIIVLAESILLSGFGTTVGKRFFRIRLSNKDGGMLTFGQALVRSSMVLVIGMGLLIPVFTLITNYLAYTKLLNTGDTWWDAGNYVVTPSEDTDNSTMVNFALLIAFFIFVNYAWTAYNKYTLREQIKHCIATYRRQFRVDPNSGMRFDTITFQNNTIIIVIQTLTSSADDMVERKLSSGLKENIIAGLCYERQLHDLLDNDINVRLEILNSSGGTLTRIDIDKYDCN